ncbi:LapA family protein [Fundicoccus sp. Sow4_D5]|uniref:LapA family protein n=1 Tax=unclassified Fundicoccus TaxID=2761543 RepID=UPI003F924BD6
MREPWRILLSLFSLIFVVIFAVQNTANVTVNLFFINITVPLVMVILITLIIGVIVGLLVSIASVSRTRKKIKALEQTVASLTSEQATKEISTESVVEG